MTTTKAVLQGGPRDGTELTADDAGLIEVEMNGMVHRYIITTQRSADRIVYTYDGMVDPTGAQDGVENAKDRLASPAAADREPPY
jgi:hypothetical protein